MAQLQIEKTVSVYNYDSGEWEICEQDSFPMRQANRSEARNELDCLYKQLKTLRDTAGKHKGDYIIRTANDSLHAFINGKKYDYIIITI